MRQKANRARHIVCIMHNFHSATGQLSWDANKFKSFWIEVLNIKCSPRLGKLSTVGNTCWCRLVGCQTAFRTAKHSMVGIALVKIQFSEEALNDENFQLCSEKIEKHSTKLMKFQIDAKLLKTMIEAYSSKFSSGNYQTKRKHLERAKVFPARRNFRSFPLMLITQLWPDGESLFTNSSGC